MPVDINVLIENRLAPLRLKLEEYQRIMIRQQAQIDALARENLQARRSRPVTTK
jgi:hypothetical protein